MSVLLPKQCTMNNLKTGITFLESAAAEKVRSSCRFTSLETCVEQLLYSSLERSATYVHISLICHDRVHLRIKDDGKKLRLGSCNPALDPVPAQAQATSKQHMGNGFGEDLSLLSFIADAVCVKSMGIDGREESTVLKQGARCNADSYSKFIWPKVPRGSAGGTDITIQGLFSTIPVRQKDLVESFGRHCRSVQSSIAHISLCYPKATFVVTEIACDGLAQKTSLVLRGVSSLEKRLKQASVVPANCPKLHRIRESQIGSISLQGIIGWPVEKQHDFHALFVNGRLLDAGDKDHISFLSYLRRGLNKDTDMMTLGTNNEAILYVLLLSEPKACQTANENDSSFNRLHRKVASSLSYMIRGMIAKSSGLSTSILTEKSTSHQHLELPLAQYTSGLRLAVNNASSIGSDQFGCASHRATRPHQQSHNPHAPLKETQSKSVRSTASVNMSPASELDNDEKENHQQSSIWAKVVDEYGHVSFLNKLTGCSQLTIPRAAQHSTPSTASGSDILWSRTNSSADSIRAYSNSCKDLHPGSASTPVARGDLQNPLLSPPLTSTGRSSSRVRSDPQLNSGKKASLAGILESWQNPTFGTSSKKLVQPVANISSRALSAASKLSKASLHDIEVIGQVDNKFIACLWQEADLTTKKVVLVDQHAASERVQLEELEKGMITSVPCGCGGIVTRNKNSSKSSIPAALGHCSMVKSTPVPCISIHVPGTMVPCSTQVLRNYLLHHGVQVAACNIDSQQYQLSIVGVPDLLLTRLRSDDPQLSKAVQELVLEGIQFLRDGVFCNRTATLTELLASLSCHSAIRFGDCLSKEECCELIKSLSKCNLPFQCAHGRPSIIPIMDITELELNSLGVVYKQPSLRKLYQLTPK
ncbi:uncharacterized protein LOC135814603 isoform X1 [Sycon ciliatum]|uniref:uncharacterized protein LOC135814603 isoform X1 n=1 Tax=Sycon ciliatum TaxID=27933 RepID=UPI0031F6BDF4